MSPFNSGLHGFLHISVDGCSTSYGVMGRLFRPGNIDHIKARGCFMNRTGCASSTRIASVAAGGEANGLGLHSVRSARLPCITDGMSQISWDQSSSPGRGVSAASSLSATITPVFRTSRHPIIIADSCSADAQNRTSGAVGSTSQCPAAAMTGQGRNRWRQERHSPNQLPDTTDAVSKPTPRSRHSGEHRSHPRRVGGLLPPPTGPPTDLVPPGTSDARMTGIPIRRQPRPMASREHEPGRRGVGGIGGARREGQPRTTEVLPSGDSAAIAAAAVAADEVVDGVATAGRGSAFVADSRRTDEPSSWPATSPSGLGSASASTSASAPGHVSGITPAARELGFGGRGEERRPSTPPLSETLSASEAAPAEGGGGTSVVRRGGPHKAPPVRRLLRQPGHRGGRRGADGSRLNPHAQASSPLHPYLLTGILRTASSVPKLKKYVGRYGSQFNNLHVCCCLNRLAKAPDARAATQRETVKQLLDELGDKLVQLLPDCDARELCNVLWVWGKLGHTPKPETWEAIRVALFGVNPADAPSAASSSSVVAAGPGTETSGAKESMSTAAAPPPPQRGHGASALRSSGQQGGDHPVAGTVIRAETGAGEGGDRIPDESSPTSATHGSHAHDVLAAIGSVPAGRGSAPVPLQVVSSATATAAATTAAAAAAVACTAAQPATGKLELAAPQGLVNAAWALARLACSDPWAWRRLAECSLAKLHAFVPYDISNLSYALVVARQHRAHPAHEALMRALATAAEARLSEFYPQDISNMLWAYARGGMAQPALFSAAAPIARLMAADFSQAGLVQVMWAYAAMRVYDAPLLGALAGQMLPQLHRMEANSQVMLCWAFARFVAAAAGAAVVGGRGGAAATPLPPSSSSASSLGGMSLFLAARVRAGFVDPLVRLHMAGGQAAVAAAATAAASAALSRDGGGGVDSLVLSDDDTTFSSSLASDNISMGTLARAYVENLAAGSSSSSRSDGGSAAIAALMPDWAMDLLTEDDDTGYGTAGYDSFAEAAAGRERVHAAATAAATAVNVAQSQVEAFAAAAEAAQAVLAEMPPQLLPSLCESLRPRVDTLDTGSLAVFVWALATLGHADVELFHSAAAALTPRLRRGEVATPFLAHTAWAFTVAGVYDSDLYGALAESAAALCAAGPAPATSLALGNVLWALGSAGHYDAELYGTIGRVAVGMAATPSSTYDRQAVNRLALVMLACAYTGHVDAELYGMVSDVLRRAGAGTLADKSLANICWSLAVVDHPDLDLLAELFADVARRDVAAMGVRGCTQLFHCALWLQDLVPGGNRVVPLLPRAVLEVGRANFLELAKDSRVSDFQAYVFNALDSMRLSPSLETKTPDQLFSLDVALCLSASDTTIPNTNINTNTNTSSSTSVYSGFASQPQPQQTQAVPAMVRVAVEANGPQHYLRTHPTALEGSTLLRSRLLRARGWVALHVHWREWQDLGGDVLRQRRYLRAKLGELLQQEQR